MYSRPSLTCSPHNYLLILILAFSITSFFHTTLTCTAVDITIDTTSQLSRTSETSWACVNLDWWPETKCDYGICPWGTSSLLTIDLDNQHLINAVKKMSPVFLRLGGSLSDFVRYDFPGVEKCVPFSVPINDTHNGYQIGTGCLTKKRWDHLNQFCDAAGCSIIFDVGALLGRTKTSCPSDTNCAYGNAYDHYRPSCCGDWYGDWDSKNARQLLEYTKKKNYKIWGFEFGNEIVGEGGIEAHLSARQYAKDFCVFSKLVKDVWHDDVLRPKVIAPDAAFERSWYADFLRHATMLGCVPDVLTWHQYILGAGVNPVAGTRAIDPYWLDRQKKHGDDVESTIRKTSKQLGIVPPEIWVGEAGGTYNSGRKGVTNAFVSSFWFLDSFGILAQRGHQTFCRQTLVGGDYGLLEKETFRPNPDYYALLLWQKKMGKGVLGVEDDGANSKIRAYAHCSGSDDGGDSSGNDSSTVGDVAVLLINLSAEQHEFVTLSVGGASSETVRIDYVISSDSIDSQRIKLNGKWVNDVSDDGTFPMLAGVERRGNVVVLEPLTYGFYVFKSIEAIGCQQFNRIDVEERLLPRQYGESSVDHPMLRQRL